MIYSERFEEDCCQIEISKAKSLGKNDINKGKSKTNISRVERI